MSRYENVVYKMTETHPLYFDLEVPENVENPPLIMWIHGGGWKDLNRKWNLAELFDALRVWQQHRKQMLTFEYILIQGVNDDLDQARRLAAHARALEAKVNLIPCNPVEGLPWQRPPLRHCQRFLRVLTAAGVPATLRVEKGCAIDAACGQLRLKEEAAARGAAPVGP